MARTASQRKYAPGAELIDRQTAPLKFEDYQSAVWKRCRAELEKLNKQLGDIEANHGHLPDDDRIPVEIRDEVSALYADATIAEDDLRSAREREVEHEERIKELENELKDRKRTADAVYEAMRLWLQARLPRDVRAGIVDCMDRLTSA